MEITGLSQTGSKLLEAFEKLGTSQGSELRSPSGPSGSPPNELVREFEAALAHGDSLNGTEPPHAANISHTVAAASPDPVSGVSAPDMGGKTQNVTLPQEVYETLDRFLNGSLSPTELFQLQYQVGMLNLQVGSGQGISQQATQGLESLLKKQG